MNLIFKVNNIDIFFLNPNETDKPDAEYFLLTHKKSSGQIYVIHGSRDYMNMIRASYQALKFKRLR